jgi:hypothetical protein
MRLLGALLFIAALFAAAAHLSRAERRRLCEAEGLYLLLLHIKTEISERALPLGEIYAAFENEALSRSGFLSVLKTEGLAAALASPCLSLPPEDTHALSLFAASAGKRFWEEELAACERELLRCEEVLEAYKREAPRRVKIKRTLVLSGGGMVLLFLL